MDDFVRQLTLQGSWQNEPRLRLQMAAMLNRTDWRPSLLSPQAILLIQRLQVPLRAGRNNKLLSASRPVLQDAKLTLTDLAYKAKTPVNGSIPANASVILFRDKIEAIACLSLTWPQGKRPHFWWCQSLLRYWRLSAATLADVFVQQCRSVPAALTLLHEWGMAEAIVQAIDETAALTVLRAMGYEFEVAQAVEAVCQSPSLRHHDHAQPAIVRPLWKQLLSTEPSMNSLNKPQAALLGIALTIQQQPTLLRLPATIAALQNWWVGKTAVSSPLSTQSAQVAETVRQQLAYTTHTENGYTPAQAQLPSSPEQGVEPSVTNRVSERLSVQSNNPTVAALVPQASQMPYPMSVLPKDKETHIATFSEQPTAVSHQTQQKTDSAPLPSPSPSLTDRNSAIRSQLGGVFYLINVMLALDLLTGLEKEAQLVSPWEVLAGVARLLLATTEESERYGEDSLWEVLAELNGRSATAPLGSNFTLLPPYQPVATWPQSTHPLDITPTPPLLTTIAPAFLSWLQFVTPFIMAHLQQAMPTWQQSSIINLLTIDARLFITHTHVDVILPLETVALPVRLAGLDFDPGWLPRWGRVVLFHYE